MQSYKIKAAIEAATKTKINLSTYHCTGWEGYANTIENTPTVRYSQSSKCWFDTKEQSKESRAARRSSACYDQPSAEAAKVTALILIAKELGMHIPDSWESVNKKRAEALKNRLLGV